MKIRKSYVYAMLALAHGAALAAPQEAGSPAVAGNTVQVRVECPPFEGGSTFRSWTQRWTQINSVLGYSNSPVLDRTLYGVKLRDLTKTVLEQAYAREIECQRAETNVSPSMQQSVLENLRSDYGKLLTLREQELQREAKQQQLHMIAKPGDLKNVKFDQNGLPERIALIRAFDSKPFGGSRACNGLDAYPLGFIHPESFSEVEAFARMCQMSGLTDERVLNSVLGQMANLRQLYQNAADFSRKVGELAANPNRSLPAALELLRLQDQILERGAAITKERIDADPMTKPFEDARAKLAAIGNELIKQHCERQFAAGKFPKAWRTLYWTGEHTFFGYFCGAVQAGAQVRYLASGLFSKEGFEITSKSGTAEVFVDIVKPAKNSPLAIARPDMIFVIPASAKINGKTYKVTDENILLIQHSLGKLINGQ